MTTYPLEPDRAAWEAMGRAAVAFVADFVERLPQAPAADFADADAIVADLLAAPGDAPADFDALLATFDRAARVAVDTAGPGYLAYIPGGGLVASALAEMLARAVNRYTGIAAFAPALVAMEESVVRWLCREFGLPAGAAGTVTTGGSLATLTAVVAAREDRLGDGFADGVLYVTAQTHHCVAKAARVVGLPASRVRVVPTTADLRMDVGAAAVAIAADRAAGLRPFFLVGTAGATNAGMVDPLADLADLARREELWFHVDGAYGGCFQLTDRGRARFAGIEAADSVVIDPHKGLFLPYGTGVVLVRDGRTLRAAFAADADYLQDIDDDRRLPDYAALGPELTRDFRGLRLWLPLHLHGVAAFRAALDEKLDLARAAYEALAGDPLLETPWRPDLSTVVFRPFGDDARAEQLLARINAAGPIFLASTQIEGRRMIRFCVLSHRTHAAHVEQAIDIIRRAAREI